jgi:hypothetical protein
VASFTVDSGEELDNAEYEAPECLKEVQVGCYLGMPPPTKPFEISLHLFQEQLG